MLHRLDEADTFVIYYESDSGKCVLTLEDAVNADQELLSNIHEELILHAREVALLGRYIQAGESWTFANEDDLWLILDYPCIHDKVKDAAAHELEKRRRNRLGYVYILRADNGLFKIGQSKVVDDRIKQLGLKLPYELDLVLTIQCEHYKDLESQLHESFRDRCIRGEWFDLDEADIEYIRGLGT